MGISELQKKFKNQVEGGDAREQHKGEDLVSEGDHKLNIRRCQS